MDDVQRDIFNDLLKRLQDNSNDKSYSKKKPSDKITCIVCGGHYTRSKKCVHDKTKKHFNKLNERYQKLLDVNAVYIDL